MTSSDFSPVARHGTKRGFALIATISIMALLVMVALGMLSLSTIELRASKNGRAVAEAQANARMALMIAIGELQKQMGPDQRISANADILSLDDSGIEVAVANPHWTGVWDSWVAGDLSKASVGPNYPSDESHHQTIGSQSDDSMRPAYSEKNLHFRKWLVSLLDSDIDSTDPQNTAITLALDADRAPSDSSTAVELVGVGSLGASAASEDYVNASLIQLLDKDSAKLSGRYGWWIGDESQKARIMDDSYETDTVAAADAVDADKIFRSQAPASTGTQAIDELANVNDQSRLAAISSTKTLDLISRNAGNANASPSHRFHDISTHSMSLLTDVREGGLKRDLSTLLERTIDPDEVFNFSTYTTTTPWKRTYKTVSDIKPDGDDFMLYRFDDFGRECVPIQDLNAYYQLYDNEAYISGTGTGQGSRGRQQGVAYSSTLIPNGIQLSAADLGGVNTQDKYKRAYTNRYRQPVPIKLQFMLAMKAMPIPADIINHYKTMPKPVRWNDRPALPDPTILNYPNFDSTHFLAVSVIPSITMWNPSNLPVVMKGGDPIAHAQRISLGGPPLYVQWEKKGALGTIQTRATQLSWVNGSGLWYGDKGGLMFNSYLAGSRDVLFEPGEVKVFSYLPKESGVRRLKVDNDHAYLLEQELHDGWDPGSYLRADRSVSAYHGGAKWNGNNASVLELLTHVTRPRTDARGNWVAYGETSPTFLDSPDPQDAGKYHFKLMFNGTDEIDVKIGTADFYGKNDDGNLDFTDLRANSGLMFWCIQHETFQLKYNNEFRYHQMQSRINTAKTSAGKKSVTRFNSELMRMGMPLKDSGPTRADDITVPTRLGQNIIDYDLEGDSISDEWPFMQFSLMAACEVGGASNVGHMAGRRYANRPFLHSTAMASTFFDKTDPASLYNYGWNWWAEDANDSINEGVQLDENNRGYYGGGYTVEEGTTHVVQQEIPIVPPLSIAALSHAHLGGYSIATDNALGESGSEYERETVTASGVGGLFPHTLQAIGNSYANPNLLPNKAFAPWDRQLKDDGLGQAARTVTFADHSYLANKALWDEFFFSSIIPKRADRKVFEISTDKTAKQTAEEFFLPEVGEESVPLPNRRMQPYMTGLDQSKLDKLFTTSQLFNNGLADKIAAHLMVEGGFNINSTSAKAWETLLKSLRGKPVNHLDTDPDTKVATLTTTPTTGTPVGFGFVTNSPPITSASTEPSESEQWTSSRVLSDVEVEELAVAIVKQVKMRGPFLSLSEFINRKLDDSVPALAAKGALQAALDDDGVSINANFLIPKRQLSSNDIDGVAFPEALAGPAAYGSAAYIDQADVLRNLSAQLTPRGDTFVIRTYGDSMDTNGKVIARAWCEAVVQRVPEYTDSIDSQETKQADLSSSANRDFGRKLKIRSFRWLNSSEV